MKEIKSRIMRSRLKNLHITYYAVIIIILFVIEWIYIQSEPIFFFEKMLFLFSFGGIFHQGIYYCLSGYNHMGGLILSCMYALIEMILLFLCIQGAPHYLYYNTLDVQYKGMVSLMFVPVIVTSSAVMQERKKLKFSVFSFIKQIILIGCIFIIIYMCFLCFFSEDFNLDRANRYFAMQEKAGFVNEDECINENSGKFKEEEIKQIESMDSIRITLTEDGEVHFSELMGTLSTEVETWENVAFISCGKTHVLGLTYKGDVLAAGEGFYGQTDVEGLKNIEYIYAGEWKSYLISANGELTVVGRECKEADYDKLAKLYELVKE